MHFAKRGGKFGFDRLCNAFAKGRQNSGAIKTANSNDKGVAEFFAITVVQILKGGKFFGVALIKFGTCLFGG